MSVMDGPGSPDHDGRQGYVLQIYPRLVHNTSVCCTLQVSGGDTAATVIQQAVETLGLDMSQPYSLLEIKESGGEESVLEAGDRPVQRLLQWPVSARQYHPQCQGYHFILQNTVQDGDPHLADCEENTNDLCHLPTLTEDTILEALQQRFYKQKIYTYASNILIAVNPFKFFPMYYNPKYVKMYEKQPMGRLSPHIFAIAGMAYHAMLNKQVNQCIVISGESGSGKTESTSFIIHCLTALSQKHYCSGMERTILGAGPVLEAFGNAKTAQNNNSSRFGKFIQLHYLTNGVVRGAVIEKYLLEKCRLVVRDKNERNYHVFYYLLVGASKEEQKEFQLLQPQHYLYLQQVDGHLEDEETLRHEYKRLHQAMEMVGFLASTKKQIFSILSAILYLGNVTYTLSEDGQVLKVGPADVLSTLSELLQVKKDLLVRALTKRRAVTSTDTLILQYTLNEAATARDSMAKSLYNALFDWIVLHINHAMLNRRDMEESVSCLSIGILDIFGFEVFKTNSFEQFCINYANERLQYYFNQHIFKLKQKEYIEEGITWHNIYYTDNIGCIQMISNKPTGLFHLLDEESNLPQTTDDTLLDKLKQQLRDNPYFMPTPVKEPAFIIRHYAGKVKYNIKGFREKNTDHMRPDIVSLLRSSERAFLRGLVGSSPVALFRWGVLRATVRILSVFKEMGRRRAESLKARRRSRKSLGEIRKHSSVMAQLSSTSMTLDFSFDRSDEIPLDVFEDIFTNYEKRKKSRGSRQKQLIPKNLMNVQSLKHIVSLTLRNHMAPTVLHPQQRKKTQSINAQFQASLGELLKTIESADPFFICCIRSNAEKKAMHFDDKLVLQQIKYTGILEMVRIQKSGYDATYTFTEFVEKFWILLPKGCRAPEDIAKLLQKIALDKTTYQIGRTKVFLKDAESQRLQDTLNKEVMRCIILLQRWFRACLIRMHFLQRKCAAMLIQRSWREFYTENRSRAATVIQTAWRTSLKREEYLKQQEDDDAPTQNRPGRQSLQNLKRQDRQEDVEPSPNREQDPTERHGTIRREPGGSKREGRGSPPPLNRPLSLPLYPKPGRDESPTHGSTLRRYTKMEGIRKKAEKWKEKRSEDELNEDSSPDSRSPMRMRSVAFKNKSMSVDDLSNLPSSGSDISPSKPAVKVNMRTKHRRHLACTRSGLMFDLTGSKDTEFWSFPLPPISPHGPSLKMSASSVDLRTHTSQVKKQLEPDGTRFSFPVKGYSGGSDQHDSNESHPTPEKTSFFTRLLRKRKESPNSEFLPDKEASVTSYSPHPYRAAERRSVRRNLHHRISRGTRAEQWSASFEREITNTTELRHLDEFLGQQVNELRMRIKELSPTESVFLTATMEFREFIKSMYSVLKPQISYKDLMTAYQNKVNSIARPNEKAEVSLVVNLFQSMLDGFIRSELKRVEAEPVKSAKKAKRMKSFKYPESHLNHMFNTYQVNILQSCDMCVSYIWGMEKAYMCSACKLICHKKCLNKLNTDCSTRCAKKDDSKPSSCHFGVPVSVLTNKANPLPKVVELLLIHVEMNGLYTEGIYRKSGSTCQARELYQIFNTNPETVSLENYHIHNITGLVKRWLRELPTPLMTFPLYNDFLHAVELPEKSEQIRAIYQKVEELPPANYKTLERLLFHLVKVAKEEEHNRMTPNSLAIVFAPCLLRSPDANDPLLAIKDISKTTLCVELLIMEQFKRYKEKMQDIHKLELAEALAVTQLKLKRQNTIAESMSKIEGPEQADCDILKKKIMSFKEKKEDLAYSLPNMEEELSDSDTISVGSEIVWEDNVWNRNSEGNMASPLKTQKPASPSIPPELRHRFQSLESQIYEEEVGSSSDIQQEHSTDAKQCLCFLPGHVNPSNPSLNDKTQLPNKKCNGCFDNLEIPFIDEDI